MFRLPEIQDRLGNRFTHIRRFAHFIHEHTRSVISSELRYIYILHASHRERVFAWTAHINHTISHSERASSRLTTIRWPRRRRRAFTQLAIGCGPMRRRPCRAIRSIFTRPECSGRFCIYCKILIGSIRGEYYINKCIRNP